MSGTKGSCSFIFYVTHYYQCVLIKISSTTEHNGPFLRDDCTAYYIILKSTIDVKVDLKTWKK